MQEKIFEKVAIMPQKSINCVTLCFSKVFGDCSVLTKLVTNRHVFKIAAANIFFFHSL